MERAMIFNDAAAFIIIHHEPLLISIEKRNFLLSFLRQGWWKAIRIKPFLFERVMKYHWQNVCMWILSQMQFQVWKSFFCVEKMKTISKAFPRKLNWAFLIFTLSFRRHIFYNVLWWHKTIHSVSLWKWFTHTIGKAFEVKSVSRFRVHSNCDRLENWIRQKFNQFVRKRASAIVVTTPSTWIFNKSTEFWRPA